MYFYMVQSSPKKNKIAIVGAGPSGIYCALTILNLFKKNNYTDFCIDVFDKDEPLKTILKTGNGRCNITNFTSDIKEFASNYPRGEKFLYSIFSRHFIFDTLDFFKSIGIDTYTEDDNRVFPVSQSAKDVRNKLLTAISDFKNIKFIKKKIHLASELSSYNKIVISCGSKDSENLIKSFGHEIVEFKKALCALNIENNYNLQGVSIKSEDGDFIFTRKAVSGPLIFKISSINAYKDFPYEVKIKLYDENKLFELVKKYPKKSIGNLISTMLPRSFVKQHVPDFDKNACEISKSHLVNYSFLKLKVISTYSEGEIVRAGGVKLSDLDKNCKSKLKDNLWFCGEIIDVDGFCGGFNLQNCWSSAYCVAFDVVSSIISNNNLE